MPMSVRLLRPRAAATAGFDPRSIGNLAFWLDASDESTITTVSGNVSEWRSKAGTSLVASQGAALNRPAYTAAGRNGRNVVTFDGTNDFLTTSTLSINQPFTIVWAGNSIGPAPNASPAVGPYICDGSTSNTRVAIAWNGSATVADNGRPFLFASSVVQPSAGATAYNAWSVLSAVFNGGTSRMRANGSQVATGNVGATNITALNLGDRFQNASGITQFNGPWGAFLVFSAALSDAQCLAVERYLGNLFAVTIP